jgi:ribonuclease HI|tara:strand:+ start:5398 stop:5880 length:483 start_codon:yes stop_codon:yes gene_type:complete
MKDNTINIFTDGSSRGNPGPGGYGIVMEQKGTGYFREFSEGFRLTTNNRMELLAVIEALNKIKTRNADVVVYTDSKYVSDSVEKKWVFNWKKNNFKKKKNIDLWTKFLKIYPKYSIKFIWIKGHNDHPQNERCDSLAVAASKKKNPLIDQGYENKEMKLL